MPNRRPVGPKLRHGRKNDKGEKLCCHCDNVLTGRKISWCSDLCALRYRIAKGDQNAARIWLEHHAKQHECKLCGVRLNSHPDRDSDTDGKWEADHIVPIVEGGPLAVCNLRALCVPCHRAETKALAGRRAEARRKAAADVPRETSSADVVHSCPACGDLINVGPADSMCLPCRKGIARAGLVL